MRREAHLARLLARTDPDGACAAYQREWVVADQRCRTREFETDGIAGEGANGVELVCNSENDPGRISSVGNQGCVIGQEREFLIDALAGEAARDDLLALDISVNAQIAPGIEDVCRDRR